MDSDDDEAYEMAFQGSTITLDADADTLDIDAADAVLGTTKPNTAAATSSSAAEVLLTPESLVRSYELGEEGSFIDPDQPAPHPAYYYDTIYVKPSRPAFSATSISLEQDPNAVAEELPNGPVMADLEAAVDAEEDEDVEEAKPGKKFGTWDGVMVSCLLNIFGVIMFLRLAYVQAHAGIWQTTLIVLVSNVITGITAMSMSAIVTNGKIGGGGAYYLISRSLGPEFGSAIGVLFSMGQAIAVSLYIVGFAETLSAKLREKDGWGTEVDFMPSSLWDIRLYGLLAVILLLVMALIGVGWVIKMQIGLLVLLVACILAVMIGAFYKEDESAAVYGYGGSTFSDNMSPQYRDGESIVSAFSLFFPAVTGIMAGANLSGDLEDPAENIPKGTFAAILISMVTYIALAWSIGGTLGRFPDDLDATSFDAMCANATSSTLSNGTEIEPPVACSQGTYANYTIMEDVSVVSVLIVIGVFAATLSSALASLVGSPRIFQAVCKDGVLPGKFFKFFAKGVGPGDDPKRGYFLAFGLAVLCIFLGDLNAIAPLISMFFMMTYALINLACFTSSITKAPGWRPAFRYYNGWVALFGSFLCAAAMFLISWWNALLACAIGVFIYLYVFKKAPPVSWGPTGHAYRVTKATRTVMDLRKIPFHAKTWRPNFLIMVPNRESDRSLMTLCRYFNKGRGMMIASSVIVGRFSENLAAFKQAFGSGYMSVRHREGKKSKWIKMFVDVVVAPSWREGAQMLLCAGGVGKLRPNSVVMGFPDSYLQAEEEDRDEYVGVVRDSFELGMNVLIARGSDRISYEAPATGTIDVYWLVDDGGFSVLLPYLLHSKNHWSDCEMRIISVAANANDPAKAARQITIMDQLVREFRLNATVHVEHPEELEEGVLDQYLAESTLDFHDEDYARTKRYLMLHTLMQEHSRDATIVFCTLPFPRENVVHYNDWLQWLDLLSTDMPPMVFLRGNGSLNVLSISL